MITLAPSLSSHRAIRNSSSPSIPANTIIIRDKGWMHIDMEWINDGTSWSNPCVLQRKTSGSWSNPTLGSAQDPESNFIWIGIKDANRYVDLGLTENTNYQYRVAYVLNYDDVVRTAASPLYSTWQYGEATTDQKGASALLPEKIFEGFAASTNGGSGGTVVKVTNLNASGAGSLHEACTGGSNRMIVFDVGGVIDMSGARIHMDTLTNITIAGQTAPSPGITIIDVNSFRIEDCDNIIVQHLKIRPGAARHVGGGTWEPDGIGVLKSTNVVIDHCSVTWSLDENLSITALPFFNGANAAAMQANASHTITVSNCLIAECLDLATHSKGPHSKGSLFGPVTNKLSVIKNMYAHNGDRNPMAQSSTQLEVINNIIYNPDGGDLGRGMTHNMNQETFSVLPPKGKLNFRNNITHEGLETGSSSRLMIYIKDKLKDTWPGPMIELYYDGNEKRNASGNLDSGIKDVGGPSPSQIADMTESSPTVDSGNVTVLPVNQVSDHVVNNVGARPWETDSIDDRIITSYETRTGGYINFETEVGGFPNPTPTSRDASWDTNGDGMPDHWKTAKGLNVATDNSADFDLDNTRPGGPVYTNLEIYLYEASEGTGTQIYDATDFGADKTGATNSWDAFQTAFQTIRAQSNTAELYCPAGTYLIYPTSPDVIFDGTHLTVVNGQSYESAFITGDMSNCIIRGDVDGMGDPSTFFNCKLWHNRPGTEYLTVLKMAGGDPTNDNDIYDGPAGNEPSKGIRRYGFALLGTGTENIEFRNLDIDMTATPVSSGKEWQSFAALRTQWDISQKGVWSHGNVRNILVKNCVMKNIRGEICYIGGFGCEKYKLEDVTLSRSNSSITSMSAMAEYVNCTFSDCANSGIENAPHALNNDSQTGQQLVSTFTGLPFYQDTIVRGCTIKPLIGGGIMEGMSDLSTADNAFTGIHIFNQEGTFQSITDTTIEDFRDTAIGNWHEYFSGFCDNITITDPKKAGGQIIGFDISPKPEFKLSGGMDYVYWSNINVNLVAAGMNNAGSLWYSISSLECQDNFIVDKMTIDGNSQTITRLVQDKYTNSNGRSGYKWRNWTSTSLTTENANFFVNLNPDKDTLPIPQFSSFSCEVHRTSDSTPTIVWGDTEFSGTLTITDIPNINKIPVGSTLKFRSQSGTQTWPVDSSWNNFTSPITVTGSEVLSCLVISQGTNKLQFISKA